MTFTLHTCPVATASRHGSWWPLLQSRWLDQADHIRSNMSVTGTYV